MDLHDLWVLLARVIMRQFSGGQIPTENNDEQLPAIKILKEEDIEKQNDIEINEPKKPDIPEGLKQHEHNISRIQQKLQKVVFEQTDRYGLAGITGLITDNNEGEYQKEQDIIDDVQRLIKLQAKKSKEINPAVEASRILQTEKRSQEKLLPFKEKAKKIRQTIESFKTKPKTNMIYFVMYDIENDKVRKKVSDYLLEKGLYRVQRSIFLGETHQREFKRIGEVLAEIQESYDNHDSIFLVPLPEDYLKSMYIIGQDVDFNVTLHRSNTVFV